MTEQRAHLLSLARRGAEVRLRELAQEARHLLELFPHLRDSFDSDELPVSYLIAEGARKAEAEPLRRRVTPPSRGAAGERVHKSWKARRKSEQR